MKTEDEHDEPYGRKQVGPVRSGQSLTKALTTLKEMEAVLPRVAARTKDPVYNREWIEALQLRNQVTLAELIATSALHRQESRGAHFRTDLPTAEEAWKTVNVIVRSENSAMVAGTAPVPVTRMPLSH